MALKTAVNTFDGGLNKDVVKKSMKPNSYHDARNVSISGDNDNFSIMGMEGTAQNVLLSLVEANYGDPEILAIVDCTVTNKSDMASYSDYTQSGNTVSVGLPEFQPGFAYIIKQEHTTPANGGKIKIVLHAANESAAAQVIYDEVYDLDVIGEHPSKVSAFVFGEGGEDFIYFSDSERFIRKIPCRYDEAKTYNSTSHNNSGGFLQLVFLGTNLEDRFKEGDSVFINFTDTYSDGFYDITTVSWNTSSTTIKINLAYTSGPTVPSVLSFPGAILFNSDRNTRIIPASVAALNDLTFSSVSSGGNLLAGTYIAYIRLLDEVNNISSDWSTATAPAVVYTSDTDNGNSTVGNITNQKLTLSFTMTQEMLDNYTSVQYALVERVSGLATYQTASLGVPEDISGTAAGAGFNFTIQTNRPGPSISTTNLIVDDASIQSAESITTKNNRLIAGGIKYKSLVYDNPSGSPIVDTITIAEVAPGVDSEYPRGYFRDELYRFGIVHFNEDGVYGNVVPIDFSGVGVNSSSGPDFKFPKRVDGGKWSIKDSVTGNTSSLGLNIGLIYRHPTWSKGFEIVRVKRKKNIQFQTPMIPTMYIGPIQATGNYPVAAVEDGPTDVAYDASPALPQGSFTIKNFFRPWNKNLADDNAGLSTGAGYGSVGSDEKAHFAFLIFDPAHVYDRGDKYVYSTGDKISIVDLALLTSDVEFYSGAPTVVDGKNNHGNYLDTEAHYTGHALTQHDYWVYGTGSIPLTFDFANSGGSSSGDAFEESEIIDYQTIENLGEGAELTASTGVPNLTGGTIHGTNKIGGFSDLQATGLTEGVTPNNLKMSAIIVKDRMPDASHWSATSTSGVNFYANHSYGGASDTIANSFLTQPVANADKNDFLINDTAQTNAIAIANVTIGLADSRYGKIDEFHEYIRTGSIYNFSDAELTTTGGSGVEGGSYVPVALNSILGGDCFITRHDFKISDGVYGNAATEGGAATLITQSDDIIRWDKSFHDGTAAVPSGSLRARPVPYKAVSQTISIYLESEINAGIQARIIYNPETEGTEYHFPSGSAELKTPFLYDYSSDYSLEGDGKVFFPADYTLKDTASYPARLVYSNQKIYQSFEEGFDRYPALNFFDLEERYGDIANLHTFKDRVYAFQENAISYLPIDKGVIETADGVSLSLQTGQIIGTPIFVSTYLGSTVGTNIISNNDVVFAIDRKRGAILAFNGTLSNMTSAITDLSARGMETFFRGVDYTDLAYDYSRKELIVYDRHSTAINAGVDDNLKFRPVIFSDKTKAWIAEIDGVAGDFIGFAWQSPKATAVGETRTRNGLLAMARVSGTDNITVHDMYEDTSSTSIFGTNQTPYVVYTSNEDILDVKTFDVLAFYSDKELGEVVLSTEEPPLAKSATTLLNVPDREGVFRVKALRGVDGSRIRGLYSNIRVEWNPDFTAKLSHAVTKYRVSNRAINTETKE